jgi:lactose/L-arabinose transport system permease protein
MSQIKRMVLPSVGQKSASPSLWQQIKKQRWAYVFISPFYISFAIFSFIPLVLSLWMSLTRWKGVGPMKYAGFINFSLVLHDKLFWKSVMNGVWMALLHIPVIIFLSLALAVILSSGRVKGFRFFRTIIFLPYITNMAAAGFTFAILLEANSGLVNVLLRYAHIPPVPWLENEWWARISLTLLILWAWLGYDMVIMLAGLQTIPPELTEAALVDGATPIQQFFRISIPLMRPVIIFLVITSTMASFNLFTEVFALTNTGPAAATLTPIIRIYNIAFDSYQFGYASALGYVFFAIIFIISLIQFRFNRDRE